MVVSLLTKFDMENGGTGAPSVLTPGLRWIFRGFIASEGGAPQSGQFKVNGGALTTYNIGSIIGANDNPSIDITASPTGSYVFEYNIEECDLGSRLTLSNATCPTCNAGTASDITVCNGSCTVDLFTHLSGGADAGGSWSQVSGTSTLVFTNGGTGTVNFSGITPGAYVVRYTVLTCTVDMNITVQAPPNAGTDKTVVICDNGGSINFGNEIPGSGNWVLVGTPPPFGSINYNTKVFTAQWGDGGNTYEAFLPYVFRKTVESTGIVPECANLCNDTADLTVNVYHHFSAGSSVFGTNVACNDTSARNLRDLFVGETPGGIWEYFGSFSDPVNPKTFIVNGSNQTLNPLGARTLNGGDNPTVGFPSTLPPDEYAFRYIVPSGNQNATCATRALVTFVIQNCGTNCSGNAPTINKNVSGNCVNATRGGSLTSSIATEVWTYRTSPSGTFVAYNPGTDVCALPYVEFKYILTFTGGCPSIERSVSHTQANNQCSNSPTVTASFANCQFTISPGGSNASPVGSDQIQWRYQGSANWAQYTGPITITGTANIEYRRVVSYSDGCAQVTTATQVISGQCGTSCNVSIGVNGSNNLLTASTSGCGQQGQSINWYYSANGSSYGGVIGSGFTYIPSSNGWYKAILTCGTCTDEDVYQFTAAPPPCSGSVSISNNGGVLTATRSGCAGNITYDWTFSATGTGWAPATGDTDSQTLTATDGPGFYRVFTFCNGTCLLSAEYEITGSSCNNNPTVSCNFNTSTCQYTLTPGGTISNQVTDTIWWKEQGSLNIHQYTVPFVHNGPIEYMRQVSFFGGCPAITTAWAPCSGTCCNGNTIDVNCSFNQTTCQYTLSNVTNVTNTITSDVVTWRPVGVTGWNVYTGPFIHNGNIEYQRVVNLSGGCGQISTPVKTCSGSCCTGNNPTVTASFNSTNCLYTITGGGTNSSAISTDILEWRATGSSGAYTMYTAPFTGPSSIEVRRRVTYADGCTATVPGSASGSCCNGNNPGASCNYNNSTCQYTLSSTGNNTSPVATDIIRWRPLGSGIWNTYSGAFSNNGQIEFQRVVTYSNGCPDFLGTIQTCNGSCCNTNNPDVSCNFSGANCTYTLSPTGTVNNPATDTIQYRTIGATPWTTYSGPFTNPGGSIEYRRVVTFSDGCTTITTTPKTCQCCANSNIGVSHSFNSATCTHTITLTGSSTVAVATDVTEWRQLGTSNAWTVYSGPFTGPSQIEIRRNVVYVDNCPATATGTGTGVCCNGNTPDVTCSKDQNTCTYTLTPSGTNTSPIATDIIEWRNIGGGWSVYSSPIVNQPNNIEYRRTVTYSNGCPSVQTAIKTCTGTCCNSAPTVSCSFNTTNCQYTLTPGGTISNQSTDVIEWRVQGSSPWNTYSGPFTSSGIIEYRRTVTHNNGCTTSVVGILTCSGTCCTGNNPTVSCNYNTTTCQYTLNTGGTNASPIQTDIIEWRPIGVSTWTLYNGAFAYSGQIEYRRSVTYSNSCGSVITTPQTCNGTCCTGNNPDVICAFDTQACLYTLTKTGTVNNTNSDVVYWRAVGSGSWTVYSAPFAHAGQIEFYRAVTFSNGCAAINTATKQCSGTCCGSNNPGISCAFNPTTCEYTLSNTGTNVSTVTTDVKEWRTAGSTGAWTTYAGPFTGPANIEARRVVSYSNCSAVTATTTCGGACCNSNAPTVSCSFNPVSCTHTFTAGGTNTSPVASDIIQWRIQGSGGAWNTYSSPVPFSGFLEYRRVVTYSNGCTGVTTSIQSCGGQCCTENNGDVTCSFNINDCKYTLSKTGILLNVTNDIVQWRPASGGSWTTYTIPFVHNGPIEFKRTATSTNSCPNYDTGVKTCSGDCCTSFNVTASVVNNQLQASASGCVGTVTYLWYYNNVFIASGTTINPVNGAGVYEVRASCSVGNCQDTATVTFTCNNSAQLTVDANLVSVSVTGLTGCTNPTYFWEFSFNGTTWETAIGNNTSSTLVFQNANGFYRVTILCNGVCPLVLSYRRVCSCLDRGIYASISKTSQTTMTAVVSGCNASVSYFWTAIKGGAILSGQNTLNITNNGTGEYYLTINCSNICGSNCNVGLSSGDITPVCSKVNSDFSGGNIDIAQGYLMNGNGTFTIYFTPNTAPDRFLILKNQSIYYDSGCCTINAGGLNTLQYGCADVTYFQPTGATVIPAGNSENPFSIICWKVDIPVQVGDSIQIQIVGGCTGCAFLDNQTNWGLRAKCNYV